MLQSTLVCTWNGLSTYNSSTIAPILNLNDASLQERKEFLDKQNKQRELSNREYSTYKKDKKRDLFTEQKDPTQCCRWDALPCFSTFFPLSLSVSIFFYLSLSQSITPSLPAILSPTTSLRSSHSPSHTLSSCHGHYHYLFHRRLFHNLSDLHNHMRTAHSWYCPACDYKNPGKSMDRVYSKIL